MFANNSFNTFRRICRRNKTYQITLVSCFHYNFIVTEYQRISVIEMMWEIVLVDGKVDEYEISLIRRICGLLHITGTESSEAKKRALSL